MWIAETFEAGRVSAMDPTEQIPEKARAAGLSYSAVAGDGSSEQSLEMTDPGGMQSRGRPGVYADKYTREWANGK